MSDRWGYRCETCHVDSETWGRGEPLREAVQLWDAICTIRASRDWEVGSFWRLPALDIFEFLDDHIQHSLVLVTSYGKTEPIGKQP